MLKIRWVFSIVFLGMFMVGLNAQKTPGTLVFKDGSSKKGFVRLFGSEKVKFKATKKDKAVKYHFSDLDHAKIYIRDEPSIYKYIPVLGTEESLVLEEIVKGKVSLFNLISQGYSAPVGGMGGAAPMFTGASYSIKNLYVLKEGEKEATHLGSNHLFSKNFKSAASAYFKDCATLVSKIQNKDFKKKEIKAIVEYYNTQCEN